MEKLMAVIVASAAGLLLASCAEPAAEEEINEMCRHLGDLSGDSGSPEAARAKAAKVGEEYDARIQALKDEAKAASDKLAAEEQAALDEFKPQDAEKRTAVVNDFAKKQSDAAQAADGKIKQAELERDATVGKAKAAADDAEAAWNEVVFKCTADNKGASKPIAQCRIAAATKDAWEKCE